MAAPMWNDAVENFVRGEDDTAALTVSQVLLANKVKLVEVVEGLGKYLTDTDNNIRSRCIRLLADILHQLPTNFLSTKEVELLTVFLCEKLSDHHSIQPPALHGLLALSACNDIPDGVAERICQQIFKEVQTQSLAQGDRRYVYVIFSKLLYKKLFELQKMEGDFVCGFIQAMDAERDPRNLVIAFQLAQTVIKNFSLGVFVEEMFEVTSCYFPVDFNPSPKDPGGVSKEELMRGVQGCMTATPKFGQFCLPLLIEKLTSDIQSAKIDSLDTLENAYKSPKEDVYSIDLKPLQAVGCEVFGAECLNEFTGTLFSCMKREVFTDSSEQLTASALSALTALVKTLSQGIIQENAYKSPKEDVYSIDLKPLQRGSSPTHLSEFLKDIFSECKRHLSQPDLRLISPTCKLLQSVAAGSDPACWTVLTSVIPTLLEQYATHSQSNQRRSILDNLKGFLEVTGKLTFSSDAPSPVTEYKSSILEVLASAAEESVPSLRLSAVQGKTTLLSLPGVLVGDEVAKIGDQMLKHLLSDPDSHVRSECVSALKSVTIHDVNLMKTTLLPQIISSLHSEPMETNSHTESSYTPSKENLLTTLTSLATHPGLVDIIVTQLMSFVNSKTDNLCLVSAQCLSRLAHESRHQQDIVDYYYKTVLPKLLTVLLQSTTGQGDCDLPSKELLTELSRVFRYTTVSLDRRKAEDLLKTVCEVFVSGNLSVIRDVQVNCEHFKPLQASSPASQTRLVSILQAVLCSLPREVLLPDVITVLDSLLKLSMESSDSFTHTSASKCCAGILNKLHPESLEIFIKKNQGCLTSALDLLPPDPSRFRSLDVWVWLTKALVLRGHPDASNYIKKLISLLEDTELGLQAANGFLTIVTEYDDVMTTEMFANVQIFYRQKLFVENISNLTDNFQSASKDRKSCYLLAISHLIRYLPKQVLLADLKSLMPILTQSLQCEETDLLVSTLTKMTSLTSDAPDILATYLDTLVPQLLRLSTDSPTMKVRIGALQCLNALTVLPSHVTLTHKNKVTRSLQRVLDDKKRLVRREAVTARGNWFLIGEPGK